MTKCMQIHGGGGEEETQEDGALLVNIWAVWNQGCAIKMKPLLLFQYLSLCLSQLPWLSLESSAQIAYTCPGPHYFHSLHSSRSTFTHLAAACAKQCHRGQGWSTAPRPPLLGKQWQLFQKGWLIFQELQKRERTQKKMASCYPSWPGFRESWVSSVDTTKSSSGAAGAGQLWAAEAAPLLLQCMSKIERNGVKIHLPGTSSYLNNPVYCPLAMVLCHVSQTNSLHNPKPGTRLPKEGQSLGAADPQLSEYTELCWKLGA